MGGWSIALPVGAVAINAAAIAGMALVARRRGGRSLMLLTLLGSALLVRALGPEYLLNPWNPYVPALAFGLVVFLTWAMTCGETWALPVAAGVGSFCIQTHVGYVPLVVPLLVWGFGWLAWSMRRAGRLAALHACRPRHRCGALGALAAAAAGRGAPLAGQPHRDRRLVP